MGIPGLLQELKRCIRPGNVMEFKGCKVAVDAYCWLHRAAYSCSFDLCLNVKTTRYINYCTRRINMMKHFGVIPVVVFDGGQLPMKKKTNDDRRSVRKEWREKGYEHFKNGNRTAAAECFGKAVSVTPLMAYELIQELCRNGVECIVAPYEADAQLAYLSDINYVSAIITEDSDLVPFGAKKILFKMDEGGNGQLFSRDKLFEPQIDVPSVSAPPTLPRRRKGAPQVLKFSSWSELKFLRLCILSGCDYVPSLSGMGFRTAYKLISRFSGDSMERVWDTLARDKNFPLTKEYIDEFQKAEYTFVHQRVYDPATRTVIPRSPLPSTHYQPPLYKESLLKSLQSASDRVAPLLGRRHSLTGEAVRVMNEHRSQLNSDKEASSSSDSVLSGISVAAPGEIDVSEIRDTGTPVLLAAPSPVEVKTSDDNFDFLGPALNTQLARDICEGRADPFSHKLFASMIPETSTILKGTSASMSFKGAAESAANTLLKTHSAKLPVVGEPIFKSQPGRKAQKRPFTSTDLPAARNIPEGLRSIMSKGDIREGAIESVNDILRDFGEVENDDSLKVESKKITDEFSSWQSKRQRSDRQPIMNVNLDMLRRKSEPITTHTERNSIWADSVNTSFESTHSEIDSSQNLNTTTDSGSSEQHSTTSLLSSSRHTAFTPATRTDTTMKLVTSFLAHPGEENSQERVNGSSEMDTSSRMELNPFLYRPKKLKKQTLLTVRGKEEIGGEKEEMKHRIELL